MSEEVKENEKEYGCCCGCEPEDEHEHHHEEEHNHEHVHDHDHHHHDDDDCCCGHDHHHHDDDDDDDDCCCGHDHDHHHHDDDDDDDDCCCGHDHDHHHDDDDDDDDCCCGHDHHHHHDEGHKYDEPGFRLVETHKHEGATICSFEKEVADKTGVAEKMQADINEIVEWLDAQDAIIGHVKGYIKETGVTTTFSTVGYGLNVDSHETNGAVVAFASIVFGPSEEELEKKVAQVFANI